MSPPVHDVIGPGQRVLAALSIAAVAVLLILEVSRLALVPGLVSFWLVVAVVAGLLSADLVSGLIHWSADTWGGESVPYLGRRFLRPFRVHHANPDDLLQRSFVDTNGDVSMFLIPVLVVTGQIPLEPGIGPVTAAYATALVAGTWPSNQVHQWAHMKAPPRPVAALQGLGLLLSPAAHAEHHRPPYATHYCIATGWLNRLLAAIGFFAGLERLVTALTGLTPRRDASS